MSVGNSLHRPWQYTAAAARAGRKHGVEQTVKSLLGVQSGVTDQGAAAGAVPVSGVRQQPADQRKGRVSETACDCHCPPACVLAVAAALSTRACSQIMTAASCFLVCMHALFRAFRL
jgi:hypothetical protein